MLVAGVDLGGTAVNYTLLNDREEFLIEGLCEYPARSTEGPAIGADFVLHDFLRLLEVSVRQTR